MLKWSSKLFQIRDSERTFNTSLQSRVPNTFLNLCAASEGKSETEKVSRRHSKNEIYCATQLFDAKVDEELIQEGTGNWSENLVLRRNKKTTAALTEDGAWCPRRRSVTEKSEAHREVFDGNGPWPGERCETKWRIFGKIYPNVRLEGLGTEQNFRFGSACSGWPVRAAHVAMCFWQFGIAGRRINSCSFCLFFSYVVIFEIVELYSVDFVFSSMFSSCETQATKPSISPSHGVVRTSEKSVFCL